MFIGLRIRTWQMGEQLWREFVATYSEHQSTCRITLCGVADGDAEPEVEAIANSQCAETLQVCAEMPGGERLPLRCGTLLCHH
jgi:hypothetical protein